MAVQRPTPVVVDRKRNDHAPNAPTAGHGQEIDDGYRASDESGPGENGVQPNGGPRTKAPVSSSRPRLHIHAHVPIVAVFDGIKLIVRQKRAYPVSGDYERGGSRPTRGRRTERHRGAISTSGTYS
ncbi:unnamed protein product [Echinostoma caproni]|uniref:Transposase n=1 Tax=Echinostoma caproni TaxID=27848 RepID=A0A183AM67_9TREM|nr:unnamed protein product [Echinostoma caproni]